MLAAPHSGVLAITKYPASGSAVFGRTYVTYVPASRYRIASARARLMQPSRAPNSDRDEQASLTTEFHPLPECQWNAWPDQRPVGTRAASDAFSFCGFPARLRSPSPSERVVEPPQSHHAIRLPMPRRRVERLAGSDWALRGQFVHVFLDPCAGSLVRPEWVSTR